MPSTYDKIATNTLGSAAASVTFSSIPLTYTDLVLVQVSQITTGAGTGTIQINGDIASNYSNTFLTGNGSTATSTRNSSTVIFSGDASATDLQTSIYSFQNYANTTTYKTVLIRSNVASGSLSAVVGMWRSTTALDAIKVGTNTSTFIAGSTFTLYGIKAA